MTETIGLFVMSQGLKQQMICHTERFVDGMQRDPREVDSCLRKAAVDTNSAEQMDSMIKHAVIKCDLTGNQSKEHAKQRLSSENESCQMENVGKESRGERCITSNEKLCAMEETRPPQQWKTRSHPYDVTNDDLENGEDDFPWMTAFAGDEFVERKAGLSCQDEYEKIAVRRYYSLPEAELRVVMRRNERLHTSCEKSCINHEDIDFKLSEENEDYFKEPVKYRMRVNSLDKAKALKIQAQKQTFEQLYQSACTRSDK